MVYLTWVEQYSTENLFWHIWYLMTSDGITSPLAYGQSQYTGAMLFLINFTAQYLI